MMTNMNNMHIVRDLNYKLTESVFRHKDNPVLVIPLWRQNRLSLLRATGFLTMFFPPFFMRKQQIIIRIRRSNKLNKKKDLISLIIPITDSYFDFIYLLPEPKVSETLDACVLMFPHYRYAIRIYIKTNQPLFAYKFMPWIKLLHKWRDI